MKRLVVALVMTLAVITVAGSIAFAQSAPVFKLGFQTLASLIPDVAGQPLDNEHFNPANGDSLQQTSTGLMVWRKADNWTAFTNGSVTWVNGPYGVQTRSNAQRFGWELGKGGDDALKEFQAPAAPSPTATPTPAPAPTAAPMQASSSFADWQPGPGASGASIMGVIDNPTTGATLLGGPGPNGVTYITGWAMDPACRDLPWNGVDNFAIGVDGPPNLGGQAIWGGLAQHVARPDVAARTGLSGDGASGFNLAWFNPAVGSHTLYLYLHSARSGWWYKTISVNVPPLSAPTTQSIPNYIPTSFHILAGKTQSVPLGWLNTGQTMEGYFSVNNQPGGSLDIAFRIDTPHSGSYIHDVGRVQYQYFRETAPWAGNYTLFFDNSYAAFYAKDVTLNYRVY